ncbi:hypothetical protein [Polyangium sp. 6x1]|uniref:hypothetical protein n=1 Tax=Polyangium sp. 6x1 TaxID=3042689 RepID=UPI002482785F|nr:hypothetical protein [Polyangium sp. 6x1]MDI1444699.1 hypothetical protein [Polyangium sp. 6x1]
MLAIVVVPACRSDDDEARLAKLEARLGAVESDLGGRLAPPPASSRETTLSGLENRIAKLEDLGKRIVDLEAKAPSVSRVPLEENKTGNEICYERKEVCLSVIVSGESSLFDANNVFCGHMIADCNSRVVKRNHCNTRADYAVSPIKFYKTPDAKGQCPLAGDEACFYSPQQLMAICLQK